MRVCVIVKSNLLLYTLYVVVIDATPGAKNQLAQLFCDHVSFSSTHSRGFQQGLGLEIVLLLHLPSF